MQSALSLHPLHWAGRVVGQKENLSNSEPVITLHTNLVPRVRWWRTVGSHGQDVVQWSISQLYISGRWRMIMRKLASGKPVW